MRDSEMDELSADVQLFVTVRVRGKLARTVLGHDRKLSS